MKLWLTKQNNGLYMLSYFKPVKENILGTHKEDVYIIPGEPIGVRNLCSEILRITNIEQELKVGESIRIELLGRILNDHTD